MGFLKVPLGPSPSDYEGVVGKPHMQELREAAEKLDGLRILNVNSTSLGGGVAELLMSQIPLAQQLGVDLLWFVLECPPAFFDVTKGLHNGLQGGEFDISGSAEEFYLGCNHGNSSKIGSGYDVAFINDPQPLPLIEFLTGIPVWIWRCHIDLSEPNPAVWQYLKKIIQKYNALIFHLPEYIQPDISYRPCHLIPPSIDPLSMKNRPIDETEIESTIRRYNIDLERPIITQVGRFDPWKDPLGVIDVYRLVKQRRPDAQLLLVGAFASDDPEGEAWYRKTIAHAGEDRDIHILSNLEGVGAHEVNAIQRASDVALQLSKKEGFGLTVTEASWKGVPVVGRPATGIKHQILDGITGYLTDTIEEAASRVLYLLKNPDVAEAMGDLARLNVSEHYLITRELTRQFKIIAATVEMSPSKT